MSAPWTTRAIGAARWVAVAIALAGVIDPVLVARRAVRADVAVIAGDRPEAAALAGRVASDLAGRFTVARGPDAGAAAVVLAGDAPPAMDVPAGTIAFAVRPAAVNAPAIARVTAPARALVDAAVPIVATIDTSGLDAARPDQDRGRPRGGRRRRRSADPGRAGGRRATGRAVDVGSAGTGATAIRVRARVAGARRRPASPPTRASR
ncbi:MAG: hypothetical protein R2752_02530 [Vicinamibacterales bacterium]